MINFCLFITSSHLNAISDLSNQISTPSSANEPFNPSKNEQ